jgi:sugar phosphate isomerase/epimerase
MNMYEFGWCRGIEDAALLQRAGFDFIECTVVSLKLEDEREFAEQLPRFLESPLPVKAFNVLFPGDLKVVGPEADPARIRRYLEKAVGAMERIGAATVVFGSGRSRSLPEGWDRTRGEHQLAELLQWASLELDGTGITLAIEPLNTKESNIINSVDEGVQFAKLINHRAIRVLADFYHMDEEKEPLETLVRNKDWLAHIHLADTGRRAPGTGQYPYAPFTSLLRESGYQGMISAECSVTEPEQELPAGLAFMKQTFR